MPTFLIPYPWLRYFALTEDRLDHRKFEAFSQPSILSLLTQAGRSYYYDSFTALGFKSPYISDQARLDAVVCDMEGKKKDLYLVYISAPDIYGHRYGPESDVLLTVLRNIDKMLKRFIKQAEKVAQGNRYFFLGDHGMLPVSVRVDVEKEISRLLRVKALKKTKDVIYFLDSTIVRLWLMSERAWEILPNLLRDSPLFERYGTWMDIKTAKHFQVPWPDRRYGDQLWIANPGVLVFPDFFHRSMPYKGMHGYAPQLPGCSGVCILWGEGTSGQTCPSMPLTGVYDLLKKSLDL